MIGILKAAQKELDDAYEYYESQLPGLGSDFLEEFENAAQRVEEHPEAWHPFSLGTRRCQLGRFPYGIIYYLEKSGIVIIAVAHLHREPDYWQGRVSGR